MEFSISARQPLDADFGLDGHAGGDVEVGVGERRVKNNFDGDALDDFDVIADGVFGRQQTGLRRCRPGGCPPCR